MPDQFALYYGDIHVADVRDADFSQGTWDGLYKVVLDDQSEVERRLLAFIKLGEDWHERTRNNPLNPPDPNEFDPYDDLISSDLWHVKLPGGATFAHFKGAPVFMHLNGISWRCR